MRRQTKVLIAIVVFLGLIVCVKSCIDRKTPDITLAYIGDGFIDRTLFEENMKNLSPFCADIDSDGEINIDMMEISFSEELGQADRQNASQRMANAVGAGVARVYFIEEKYVINNASSGVFADIAALGDGFKNAEGQVVAVSVKGNEKVRELGIEPDEDLYIAVRIVSEIDEVTDKNISAKHASAMKIAEYILS